jgi:hypothetical protein
MKGGMELETVNNIKWDVISEPYLGGYKLYGFIDANMGGFAVPVKKAVWETKEVGTVVPIDEVVPLLALTHESASQLMDQLWLAGVRPSNGAGSQATHEALQAHIKDLQRTIERLFNEIERAGKRGGA